VHGCTVISELIVKRGGYGVGHALAIAIAYGQAATLTLFIDTGIFSHTLRHSHGNNSHPSSSY